MAAARSPKQVIDHLIKENRWWEWLWFIAACIFLLVGVGVIVRAMLVDQSSVLTAVGGACNFLIWPTLAQSRRIQKENQAIRLLEIPLSTTDTNKKAADTISEMFIEVFVNRKG